MLPLHTKVTWNGRGDMISIQHPISGSETGSAELIRVDCRGRPSGRLSVVAATVCGMTTTQPLTVGAGSPEDLEPAFAAAVQAGDLDGIVGLYAADAVVSLPRGREAAGHAAIREAFAAALAAGALEVGAARVRAVVNGDLAMTTAALGDGRVHTQVARRTAAGRWLWVRDGSRLRETDACLPALARDLVA